MPGNISLAREEKVFVKAEAAGTGYGTAVDPAGGDAIKILSCSLNPSKERTDRDDKSATRSVLERVSGKESVEWSIEKYILPSGSLGVPPDDTDLWEGLLGTVSTSTGTSITYAPKSEIDKSVTIMRNESNESFRAYGCIVNEGTIRFSGSEKATVTFAGPGKSQYHTGSDILQAAMTSTDGTVADVGDCYNFEANSLMQIGAATNPEIMKITSVTPATGTESDAIAMSRGYLSSTAQTHASGAAITPYLPTGTTAGSPIAGMYGNVVIDTGTYQVTGGEITLSNNMKLNDDQFGSVTITDYDAMTRRVSGTITAYLKTTLMKVYGRAKSFVAQDFKITIGTTAGSIVEINVDYAELDFSGISIDSAGLDDYTMITIPFVGLGSSGEDEISLVFK